MPVLSVVIDTTTVETCVGVGVGFRGVGVGVGLGEVGVCTGFEIVGVGVGFEDNGVGSGRAGVGVDLVVSEVGVGEIEVFVRLLLDGLLIVELVLAVVVLPSPPQATSTIHNATIKMLCQTTGRNRYKFLSIRSASSRQVWQER